MALPFAPRKPAIPAAFEKLQSLIESEFTESTLHFYMNGTKIELPNPNPEWTLLDFIRSQHGFKGTKLGCGEGVWKFPQCLISLFARFACFTSSFQSLRAGQ